MSKIHNIDVSVTSLFLPHQSNGLAEKFVFSYTITLTNSGDYPASLLTRHWIITNANGETEEVKGSGVVGEYPHLQPGQSYQYSSGSVLKTPVGSMQGSYQMRADDGTEFDAIIPTFTLSAIALH